MDSLSVNLQKAVASFNEFGPGVPNSDAVCQAHLDVLTVQEQQM